MSSYENRALRRRITELEQELTLLKQKQKICCVADCDGTRYDDAPYCKDHKCEICSNLRNDVGQYCDDCACKGCRERLISYNYSDYSEYCCGCGCKCGNHVSKCRCYS